MAVSPAPIFPVRRACALLAGGALLLSFAGPPLLRADEKPAPSASPEVKETPRPPSDTPLDATRTEIAKFYGPVVRANARVYNHQILDGTAIDGDLHTKDGLIIRVEYIKGRSVLLEYTRATGPLAPTDVTPLLAANAGNSGWETGKDSTDDNKFYRRLDDRAIAHWTKENDGSLLISVEDSPAMGGALIR